MSDLPTIYVHENDAAKGDRLWVFEVADESGVKVDLFGPSIAYVPERALLAEQGRVDGLEEQLAAARQDAEALRAQVEARDALLRELETLVSAVLTSVLFGFTPPPGYDRGMAEALKLKIDAALAGRNP